MKVNPLPVLEKGVQIALAYFGIGALYIYTHVRDSREIIIEGPNRLWPKDLNDSLGIQEVKFHFISPLGTTPPSAASRK